MTESLVINLVTKKLDVTLSLSKGDFNLDPKITLRQAQGDIDYILSYNKMTDDTLKKYKPLLSITLPDENILPKNEEDDEENNEDDDERFVKKDSKEEQKQTETAEEKIEANPEVKSIIGKLKNFIFPKSNKRRDLDLEVGGVEMKKQKKSDEKDVWDDRSEEVDKMGSTDTFNTTGMKSVVWKQKRARLAAKKHAKEGAEIGAAAATQGTQNFNNMGYVARLKNMKQDRSGITGGKNGGNDSGGAWR